MTTPLAVILSAAQDLWQTSGESPARALRVYEIVEGKADVGASLKALGVPITALIEVVPEE
jgi:hypothetical protein